MTKSVAKRSPQSQALYDMAANGRDLIGGTRAMRAAGKRHLPKFELERQEDYEKRLNASWLFNAYKKTIRDMTGRVFDKPVSVADDADNTLIEWLENVDLQGNNLSVFSRNVFEDAVAGAGISFIMVDAPIREGVVTKAQAADANMRPKMVHLTIAETLGWKTDIINNEAKLTQFRIMESVDVEDEDEFVEKKVDQVRVLDVRDNGVETRLFRKVEDSADDWQLFAEPTFSEMREITVVPFYANKMGFWNAEPLLADLQDVNIAHWQSQSDQRNILQAARVPILHKTGHTDDDKLEIGSKAAVVSSSENAKLSWVEHTGKSIESGRTDLKDLEFQMEAFGLQLLMPISGQSATSASLNAAKETTQLSMAADELENTLEVAIGWMMEYGSIKGDAPAVTVNKQFSTIQLTAQDFTALLSAVNTGQMSRETFWAQISAAEYMLAPIDAVKEAELIGDDGEMNSLTDAER